MKRNHTLANGFGFRAAFLWLSVGLALCLVPSDGIGQTSSSSQSPAQTSSQPGDLPEWGYNIHQSVSVGYRASDLTGSYGMYDTLVNLHSGPRILQQDWAMQSLTHEGLFDNLFLNSFGWGGDPSNALRFRADKDKWYDFRISFRHDQNRFDYNLLANPLNPTSSASNVPILNSPHEFETNRRMSDFDLTLLPQSAISIRLGYSHNNMTGPSWSSVHQGTDALLYQPWNTTLSSWRIGADWKFAPRTVLSYDQSLQYFKGDTNWSLGNNVPALLPGGGSVELGLPFNGAAGQPCRPGTGATTVVDSTGTLTNIACNGYFAYNRTQRARTTMPTETLSLRSNYIQRIEFTASYSYSNASMDSPFQELFNGLTTRTGLRQSLVTGPARTRQVSNVANVGVTLHITHHLRVVDTFYFWAYRIPENFNSLEVDNLVPGVSNTSPCRPPACSLLTPLSATTQTSTATLDQLSFNQTLKRNQTELIWDVTRKFGARVGYRYGHRMFTHWIDFVGGDVDQIPTAEQTALAGLWFRPTTKLRFNFDAEHSNNYNTHSFYDYLITRLSPRKESRYRAQANYTPRPWAVLGASANLWQASNPDALDRYFGHNRNFGFNASLNPRERFGLDLAYNYNDIAQNDLLCFNDALPVPGAVTSGTDFCATNDPGNPLLTFSMYRNHTHFGMASVMVKPVKRLTTQLGYSITSVGGQSPIFNALNPDPSLHYNFHQPVANLSIEVVHGLSWDLGWNYYQYNEKTFVGPTSPRYFHANLATVALRYAF
jgi:hypothetical protein